MTRRPTPDRTSVMPWSTREMASVMPWSPARLRLLIALIAADLLLLIGVTATDADPAGSAGRAARVTAEKTVGERLVDLTIDSPALGRTATVRLLTPDGWQGRQPGESWPTLFLLVGGDGNHKAWTEDYDARLRDLPQLRNVLVVMPEMPLFGFYTDWFNGGRGGPPAVETFHLEEVRPLLERHYGAGSRRAAAGESQGGFGALSYSARHPGTFRAAASYSGFVHPSMHPHAVQAAMTYLGLDWKAVWGDPVAQRANWHAHDPYYLADRLRTTPVYVSSGDGTPAPWTHRAPNRTRRSRAWRTRPNRSRRTPFPRPRRSWHASLEPWPPA